MLDSRSYDPDATTMGNVFAAMATQERVSALIDTVAQLKTANDHLGSVGVTTRNTIDWELSTLTLISARGMLAEARDALAEFPAEVIERANARWTESRHQPVPNTNR